MAFNPPDINTRIDRIKTYIKEVLGDLNPTDQNNFIYSLIVAMANLSNDNDLQLKIDIIPNSFVTTVKTEEALEPFATIKTVPKKLAEISTGNAVINGLAGSVIPLGAIFIANNVKYRQTQSIEVAEQSINISKIECNGKTVTVTTAGKHNFASNIPVTIAGCVTENFNGTFPITATGENEFTYHIEETTTATEIIGTASATIAVLNLRSQSAGAETNLSNGDSLAIENAIAGVGANAYTMYSGISGGANDEEFDEWKQRVIYRYQNPITYFNEANIKTTVLGIEGNTRCWVKECTPQVGQVTIYFVRDNDTSILPDSNERNTVRTKLQALRTVKDSIEDIFVYAPTPKYVDFIIADVVPNTPTMKTAIKNSIKQLFDENVDLEVGLSLDKIKSAIQNSFDLETGKTLSSYDLVLPHDDVVIGEGELAILGEVSFT